MRIPARPAVVGLALLPAACGTGVLDPAGPVARDEHTLIIDALVVMLAIVIPTILLALWAAWWFREGNSRARRRPGFVYSGRIELVVWSAPLLTIMFLGGLTWIGAHRLDPSVKLPGSAPLEVQVVALDWKWLFIYPTLGIASLNEVAAPAGRPVHFTLTGSSVLNTFWIPRLSGMIYTMAGMTSQLNLAADHPGDFAGGSAMFSGDGFPDMRFTFRALSDADFATWVATTRQRGGTLDRAAYARLSRQSQRDPVATWAHADPTLFQDIAMLHLPPGPGAKLVPGGRSQGGS